MKSIFRLTSVLIILFLFGTSAEALTRQEKRLPEKYRTWLNKEVVYIITKEEKEAFLKIDNNKLRDQFIEIFWEKRDPTPGTPKNEFREKHYKRIEFANKNFGPRGFSNGWRTERGRIYILYGEPKERLEFPSDSLVYPVELWFYSSDNRVPGASFFYILFFKRGGAGDYEIYHPKIDGPAALTWKGDFGNSDEEVMDALQRMNAEVARAAISLNPMDPGNSLASEVLLGQVDGLPDRMVDSSWATDFVNSKGKIEVTYTFKQLPVNSLSIVFSPPGGIQQLHYAFLLYPEDIEIAKYEDSFYTVFEVIPSFADENGNVIWEGNTSAEISWTAEQYENNKSTPILFSDLIPVIPGNYTFTLRVRNRVSKTYFMFSRALQVPLPTKERFTLSTPLMSYGYDRAPQGDTSSSPFRFFNIEYKPSVINEFAKVDNIHIFSQLYYPPANADGNANVGEIKFEFNIYKDEELVKKLTHIIPAERVNKFGIYYLSRQIPISDLTLGDYRLEIIASENSHGISDKRSVLFSIKEPANIPRPNIFKLHRNVNTYAKEMLLITGEQYINKGDKNSAIVIFDALRKRDPEDVEATLKLSELLIDTERAEVAFELLHSIEWKDPNNRTLVMLLAKASVKQGEFKKAIGYYERLLFLNPEDVEVLNLAADAYQNAGNVQKAREMLQKSLEMDSEQPEVREKLERM